MNGKYASVCEGVCECSLEHDICDFFFWVSLCPSVAMQCRYFDGLGRMKTKTFSIANSYVQ